MTRTNFGPLTVAEIKEIATETGIEIVQVAEAAIDLNSEWNWTHYDDVSIFVEVLVKDLEANKPAFGPWDSVLPCQMIEHAATQRWNRYGEEWMIAFEAERMEMPEQDNAEAMLETWVAAETEVMELQIAADAMGLSREEWLYRVGLVDAAKIISEAAWEAYEAAA